MASGVGALQRCLVCIPTFMTVFSAFMILCTSQRFISKCIISGHIIACNIGTYILEICSLSCTFFFLLHVMYILYVLCSRLFFLVNIMQQQFTFLYIFSQKQGPFFICKINFNQDENVLLLKKLHFCPSILHKEQNDL